MGFQALCLVHQLVCMESTQLPLCSVMVPAVEEFHMTVTHQPGAPQIHWASAAVAPEEVALVWVLAPVRVEAHPPGSVHPHIRSLLAIRHGHMAVATSKGCSTS